MPLAAGAVALLAAALGASAQVPPRAGRASARDSAVLVRRARAALERRAGRHPRRVVAFTRDSAGTVVEFFPDCPTGFPPVVCSDGGGRVRVGRDGRVTVLAVR